MSLFFSQADPDVIDDEMEIARYKPIFVDIQAGFDRPIPEFTDTAIQTGYFRKRNRKIQAHPPISIGIQATPPHTVIDRKLQVRPRLFNKGSQVRTYDARL